MGGPQWVSEIGPVTRKPLRVDMQLFALNKRTIEVLPPMIQKRIHNSDCCTAYPQAADDAQCEHHTVNHSMYFKHIEMRQVLC